MTLDQRLARAAQHVAEDVPAPAVDVAVIRSVAQHRRRRAVSAAVTAAVLGAVLAVGTVLAGLPGADGPADPASTGMDTSSWVPYVSDRYDVTLAHPPDWTVKPATQDWGTDDAGDFGGPAHEVFLSPEEDVAVTVMAAPLEPGTSVETVDEVLAWVETFCRENTEPCTRIEQQAVELCADRQACHPGVLVPFRHDVQAFFSGGDHEGVMVVVAVARGESAPEVQRYGGAGRLLSGFLSTMDVWPRTDLPR